ncbi:hypothetical protein [Clostridium akagii]|uniref:hypothetical protein n=1 Tax=Clostridium akagii TaxID=91623 RepID=UPI0004791D5E|nr:hypothetical protein [Clostridium akagii]
MKKVIKLLGLLLLLSITFVGCSSSGGDSDKKVVSDGSSGKKVAEEFVKGFYTVDSEEVAKYDELSKAQGTQFANTNDSDEVKKSEEYQTSIQSLVDKTTKPLMTEKSYKTLVINRENIMNVEACSTNNFIMEVTGVTLTKDSDDNQQNTEIYNYKSKLKFTSSKDKSVQSDTGEGQITLSKEGTQWKVSTFVITARPKLVVGK